MKHLLVFIAIVSAISSLPLIEDYYGPFWSSNRFKGVLQEAFNSSGSIHQRFIRANVDSLKAPLERLQRIARITNGIHLLNELIAGTIPADELISELLFFGPVTPSEITEMDEQAILAAIETLKNLPDNLKASTEASNAETSLDKLKELLEKIKGIGNLKEWDKDKQHFKDEIEKLKKGGINTTDSKRLLRTAFDWVDNYDILNEGTNADLKAFDEIKKVLKTLQSTINTFDNSGIHWTFNGFDTLMIGLSPITKAADGVLFFNPIFAELEIKEDDKTAYSNFLDEASSKLSSIIKVDPGLQAIQKLVTAKEIKSRQRTLKHTHGFPRGVIDLKEATYDVGDPWIKKIVNTVALKAAFNKLGELEILLSKSDNSLDFKKQEGVSIDGLLKNVASVNYIFTNVENVKSGLNQAFKCERPLPKKDVASTNFDELKNKLKEMDEKLEQLKEKTKELSSQLKKEGLDKMCEGLIRICDDAQKASNIQDSVGKFKRYEKLGELDKVFKNLQSISNKISSELDLDTLKTDAGIVLANFSALDSYHTGLNHYSDYFNCLQNDNNLKLVLQMVNEIKKTRQFKSDNTYIPSLDKGLEVVKKVTSVKKDLENSKSELDKLKEFNSSETKGLTVFKKTGDLSKVIGEAVQGVANMKNALDKKTETVDKVLNNIQFVVNNQKLLTDPTDMKNLQDLIGLKPSIQSMYSTLDTFIGGVKDNDSPILKNHSNLFESAKSVSGVTGNFLAMISSLEKLKEKIPGSNELEELQTSLKTMETMGLDFTKYQTSFDNSGSSLGDLDIAFANYNKRMARKTPSSTRQQGAAAGSQGSDNKKEKKKDDNTVVVAIIVVVVTVVCLGAAGIAGYNFIWIPRKRMKNILRFLDTLMEELYLRYTQVEKEPDDTQEDAVNRCFSDACNNDLKAVKDKVVIKTDPCKKEECDVQQQMVKESAMVLKGYGDLFKSDHYHAVVIPYSKKKKVIISHVPTKLSEKTPETVAKFFWMAKQNRSNTIVLLDPNPKMIETPKEQKKMKDLSFHSLLERRVNPEEEERRIEEEVRERKNRPVDEHIPAKKGDSLTLQDVIVKCLEMEVINDKKKYPRMRGVIEKRKLEVTIKNHEPFTVNHLWYLGWLERIDLPRETRDLVYIINMIVNDKTPSIIVSNHMQKASCLAFALFARSLICKETGITFREIACRLSGHLYSLFNNVSHYHTAVVLLCELLTQDQKAEKLNAESIERYLLFKNPSDTLLEPKNDVPAESEVRTKSEVTSNTAVTPKK